MAEALVVEVVDAEFKGAPTAISHLCPGCPCAGFMPDAVFVVLAAFVETVAGLAAAAEGAEFNGAPTAISQRCPGWPWAGFFPETGADVGAPTVDIVPIEDGAEFNGAPTAISQR